ncbi:hypothetical protein EYB25_002474 [Talaromyces marneffei]|nr:hypothetical protein EYB25_002474 [Talaromyces marneffei]
MEQLPSLSVLSDVPSLPRCVRDGPGEYSDLVASSPSSTAPVVCGVWNADDVEDGKEQFTAEWDEMKYVLTGESEWEDATSGRRFIAKSGSMIWFPKGSTSVLVRSKNLSTIYVESEYRKPLSGTELASKINLSDRLDALYESVTESYSAANLKSQANHEEALKYMPGGNTRSVLHYYPFPMSIKSGKGCRVTSLDGHEYLDFVSEFSAALFGHSHPDIVTAVQNTVQSRGFNLGGTSENEVILARHIVHRFRSIEKVRFTNSGTEANTMALAVALAHTGRKKILVFAGGYHGAFAHFGAAGPNALNLPHQFVIGQYNDTSYNNKYITEELAAILVEPMQGANGMIPASKAFLEYLRNAATGTGAILIYDEIITSRFHMGGLQEYHGIYPDMTTVGKYLAGGFSFGAFGGRADIMSALNPNGLFHSGTHNNNTFSMAAGVAASKILTAESISRINALGEKLREGINEIVARYKSDWLQATGFGSTIGLHYSGPYPTRLRDTFFFFLISRSIYIGKRGFLSLNLMHEEKDVDYALAAVEDFFRALQ